MACVHTISIPDCRYELPNAHRSEAVRQALRQRARFRSVRRGSARVVACRRPSGLGARSFPASDAHRADEPNGARAARREQSNTGIPVSAWRTALPAGPSRDLRWETSVHLDSSPIGTSAAACHPATGHAPARDSAGPVCIARAPRHEPASRWASAGAIGIRSTIGTGRWWFGGDLGQDGAS